MATLIIVLSVMNGFQKEIRGRILGVASHLEISSFDGRLEHWQQTAELGRQQPHVLAAALFVSGQGLFSAYGNVRGGLLRGIEPALENKVVDVKLTTWWPASWRICVPASSAWRWARNWRVS